MFKLCLILVFSFCMIVVFLRPFFLLFILGFFNLWLKNLMFFWLVTKIDEHEISSEGNYWLIKTAGKKGIFPMLVNSYLHFVVVLFVIITNVAKIRTMEENIMLILLHGGGLERDEYQRLQCVLYFFTLFRTYMHQGSNWHLFIYFKDLFDCIFI